MSERTYLTERGRIKAREILDEYDGKSMLIYYVKDIKKIIKNPTSVGVQICRELLDKLSGMYGEDNVKVTYA